MTELLSDTTTPSDAELISSVRGGDLAAYGELFARHKDAANRLARQLVRGPDADDLVSDAFAKVLNVLQGGGGPDVAFRAYLLTAVRRLHVDKMRATARVRPSDDMSEFDGGTPFQDTAVAAFENGAAARAFATLPERWQLVLWHLEVEGQKPADIAPMLGMSPNSVSALAYRAREGLRQAFLTMHLNDTSETDCRWVNEHLGAYVRKGLSNRDATKVQTHLDQCRRCTAMYLELTEVNSNLAGIIAPLLLGGAAAGYLSSTGAAGGLGLTALFGRVRDVVGANAGAATAAGVAAGVAAVVTAGALMLPNGPERLVTVNDPGSVTSAPATPPSSAADPAEDGAADEEPGPADEAAAEGEDTVAADTAGTVTNAEPATATLPDSPAEDSVEPSGTAASAPDQPGDQVGDGPGDGPGAGSGADESVTSDLSFSAPVSFDGDAVSFTVAGDPLPPTVGLRLVSEPRGIEFRENGSACTLASGTRAECSTGALARGGSAMLRGMASAPRAFSGSIRLRIPADQPDTLVRLVVSAPKGYTDPSDERFNSSSFRYLANRSAVPGAPPQPGAPPVAPPVAPPAAPGGTSGGGSTPPPPPVLAAAVILGLPTLTPLHPDADGTYSVPVTISATATSGPPLPNVRLLIDGQARFTSAPTGCEPDLSTPEADILCPATSTPAQLLLKLEPVTPVIGPTDVRISASAPVGYDEPADHLSDNSGSVRLLPPVAVEADASVTASIDAQGNSGKGTATATVAVDPLVPTSLEVRYDAAVLTVKLPSECRPTDTGATCVLEGPAHLDFEVEIEDRPGGETVTADLEFEVTTLDHTDPVTANNTASVSITRTFEK